MSGVSREVAALLKGDAWGGRIVPPGRANGFLVSFAALAMGLLAALALLSVLSARAEAARWTEELAQGATLTLPLSADATDEDRALIIAGETPGVRTAAVIPPDDIARALDPWLADGESLEGLERPGMIALTTEEDFDADGLRLRLTAELPGAVLDDHGRWRGVFDGAARRVTALAFGALALSAGLMAAMLTLAAEVVLARHRAVLGLLRQIGAQDAAIARAFTRRLTVQSSVGAGCGVILALLGFWLWPSGEASALVAAPRPSGVSLLLLASVPLVAGGIALFAARRASLRRLKELS